MYRDPGLLTTSTNRNLFQPTRDHRTRRRSEIRHSIQKGKNRSTSRSDRSQSSDPAPAPGGIEQKLKRELSPAGSGKSNKSQLVDLIVEDTQAEEAERVRARKEGGDAWNRGEHRHFVRTYSIGDDAPEGQEIREGWEPADIPAKPPPPERAASDDDENYDGSNSKQSKRGQSSTQNGAEGRYGSLIEEDNVWDRS